MLQQKKKKKLKFFDFFEKINCSYDFSIVIDIGQEVKLIFLVLNFGKR